MKSFRQFIAEAYDPEVQGRSQIRKQGEGGRIGRERKKTAPERKRTTALGGGKTAPAKSYKARKDIGTQRPQSDRVQQPTRERGSAGLSPREQQRKAAQERRAAKSGGKSKKDLEKAADKLLTKKTTKAANPNYKPRKASGYSHAERLKLRRSSDRLLRDIAKGKEKPASHYDPKVKKPS
tara:strand:+ start:9 stop:548 length:540 start_codon:yes stop_codon:yes gene_type:complete